MGNINLKEINYVEWFRKFLGFEPPYDIPTDKILIFGRKGWQWIDLNPKPNEVDTKILGIHADYIIIDEMVNENEM